MVSTVAVGGGVRKPNSHDDRPDLCLQHTCLEVLASDVYCTYKPTDSRWHTARDQATHRFRGFSLPFVVDDSRDLGDNDLEELPADLFEDASSLQVL